MWPSATHMFPGTFPIKSPSYESAENKVCISPLTTHAYINDGEVWYGMVWYGIVSIQSYWFLWP